MRPARGRPLYFLEARTFFKFIRARPRAPSAANEFTSAVNSSRFISRRMNNDPPRYFISRPPYSRRGTEGLDLRGLMKAIVRLVQFRARKFCPAADLQPLEFKPARNSRDEPGGRRRVVIGCAVLPSIFQAYLYSRCALRGKKNRVSRLCRREICCAYAAKFNPAKFAKTCGRR